MDDWVADLVIFCAGIAGGILIMSIKFYFSSAKKERTEAAAARARALADIKAKHEEEVLDEAFRMTVAIRGELDQSLQTLRKNLGGVLRSPRDAVTLEQDKIVPPSAPAQADPPPN